MAKKRLFQTIRATSPKYVGDKHHHDLEILYASVNNTEFNKQVDAQIPLASQLA